MFPWIVSRCLRTILRLLIFVTPLFWDDFIVFLNVSELVVFCTHYYLMVYSFPICKMSFLILFDFVFEVFDWKELRTVRFMFLFVIAYHQRRGKNSLFSTTSFIFR